MKVIIITDLEGPAGVNGRSDGIGNTMLNVPTACQALVNEVNAVCKANAVAEIGYYSIVENKAAVELKHEHYERRKLRYDRCPKGQAIYIRVFHCSTSPKASLNVLT